MKNEKVKFVTIVLILFLGTIFLTKILNGVSRIESLQLFVSKHNYIFVISLFIIKILGIVWPPIPGGIFTVAAIPLIGWELAFFVDFVGNAIGISISFYLGRKYGDKILKKLFPQKVINFIKRVKLDERKQTEGIFFVSLATGFFMVEVTSYGFGYLKAKYISFLKGSLAASLIRGLPAYYLLGNLIFGKDILLNLVLLLLSLPPIVLASRKYVSIDPRSIS